MRVNEYPESSVQRRGSSQLHTMGLGNMEPRKGSEYMYEDVDNYKSKSDGGSTGMDSGRGTNSNNGHSPIPVEGEKNPHNFPLQYGGKHYYHSIEGHSIKAQAKGRPGSGPLRQKSRGSSTVTSAQKPVHKEMHEMTEMQVKDSQSVVHMMVINDKETVIGSSKRSFKTQYEGHVTSGQRSISRSDNIVMQITSDSCERSVHSEVSSEDESLISHKRYARSDGSSCTYISDRTVCEEGSNDSSHADKHYKKESSSELLWRGNRNHRTDSPDPYRKEISSSTKRAIFINEMSDDSVKGSRSSRSYSSVSQERVRDDSPEYATVYKRRSTEHSLVSSIDEIDSQTIDDNTPEYIIGESYSYEYSPASTVTDSKKLSSPKRSESYLIPVVGHKDLLSAIATVEESQKDSRESSDEDNALIEAEIHAGDEARQHRTPTQRNQLSSNQMSSSYGKILDDIDLQKTEEVDVVVHSSKNNEYDNHINQKLQKDDRYILLNRHIGKKVVDMTHNDDDDTYERSIIQENSNSLLHQQAINRDEEYPPVVFRNKSPGYDTEISHEHHQSQELEQEILSVTIQTIRDPRKGHKHRKSRLESMDSKDDTQSEKTEHGNMSQPIPGTSDSGLQSVYSNSSMKQQHVQFIIPTGSVTMESQEIQSSASGEKSDPTERHQIQPGSSEPNLLTGGSVGNLDIEEVSYQNETIVSSHGDMYGEGEVQYMQGRRSSETFQY